jgi:nesprin-1
MEKLEKGQEQIDKFNKTASALLSSHLDTYVNNQLRHLSSRYQVCSLWLNIIFPKIIILGVILNVCIFILLQVQVNLAKDVLKKVETNLEQHRQYSENYEKALAWIENAKQVIWDCSEASSNSSREVLQARLDQIQVSMSHSFVSRFNFLQSSHPFVQLTLQIFFKEKLVKITCFKASIMGKVFCNMHVSVV